MASKGAGNTPDNEIEFHLQHASDHGILYTGRTRNFLRKKEDMRMVYLGVSVALVIVAFVYQVHNYNKFIKH
jgi:hypothetical protein